MTNVTPLPVASTVNPYEICFNSGSVVLASNQILIIHKFPVAVTFPSNFGAIANGMISGAGCLVNATANTVLNVDGCLAANDPTISGNWSVVGTITIAASGHAGTLATAGGAAEPFSQGDFLRVTGPATPDVTAASIFATLIGTR